LEEILEEINYNDFTKLDIRIGTVIEAEEVIESNKLFKLIIDFGEFKKTVLAGLKGLIEVKEIQGKQIPVLVNIAPRNTPFGLSEAMILVAVEKSEKEKISLISPTTEIKTGSKVE